MKDKSPLIVFVDNNLNYIHKSIQLIASQFSNTKAFNNASEALDFIVKEDVYLVLINLDLAPRDAILFTKDILGKKSGKEPYLVVYSEKQDDFIQEIVLNAGVDAFVNYHQKPAVLLLFIRNLLGRILKANGKENSVIVIDRERFLVFKKGRPIQLPRKEFNVFEFLYNHPDRFYSKAEIAEEIWKDPKVAEKRTIDVHVYNLRKFFGKKIIQSQKGKGYRLNSKFV